MRRTVSILLVSLFSFALIGPAVSASDADSQLPACCRRDGKHHCAMTENQPAPSVGPLLHAARCPSFPAAKAVPASRTLGLVRISQAIFAGLVSHPASRPQTEALYRISYSRAGQKRGPPTLLA
jgi:hypothetical protein